MTAKDEMLIERFVSNMLSDEELRSVQARIQKDEDFREHLTSAIDTHALLHTLALEELDDGELRETVEVAIGSERPGDFNDQIMNALGAPGKMQTPAKKPKHLKRVLLLTLPAWAAAIIILATLYTALPRYGTSLATVTHAPLPISVDRDGKQFQLIPGKTIRDGDFLTIPEKGAFAFEYDDNTSVQLSGGTTVEFSGTEDNKRLYLASGRVVANVKPQKNAPFIVESPVGSAIVVGTKLTYEVNNRKGSLAVTKGSVRLESRSRKEAIEVKAGQTGIIYAGRSPVLVDPIAERTTKVVPKEAQVSWQRMEFGGLIQLRPERLIGPQEVQLHPEQWVLACKAAGMRQVLLSVKGTDGLCLWPSPHTAHNISQSSWREGKGDLVREVANACKAHGLAFGISFTPLDKREKTFGSGAPYNQHVADLLTELCQNYGPLSEVRIPSGGENEQRYDRKKWLAVIRGFQPDAVISIRGPDARWTSRSDLNAVWSIVPILKPAHANDWPDRNEANLGSLEQISQTTPLQWMPPTTNKTLPENGDADLLQKQFSIYESTVGNNRKFLFEISPSGNGKLSRQATEILRQLGETISVTYSGNLAKSAKVRATQTASENANHRPDFILDGDLDTYWTAEDWSEPAQLIITLPKSTTFNRINLQEPIRYGQRIASFEIDAWYDGFWRQIASGSTVGHRRIIPIDSTTTNQIRIRFPKARVAPALAECSLHHTPTPIPAITRGADGKIRMTPTPEGDVHYTLDGSTPTITSPIYRTPIPFTGGGAIRARLIQNGQPISLTATADFPIDKNNWKLISATSVSASRNEKAEHAIDGDPRTIWHSNYAKNNPTTKHPHALTFDMNVETIVSAFGYTPRTDGPHNGLVSQMTFETSLDGKNWSKQARGSYTHADFHRLKLPCPPHKARYVRFTAHAEINGRDWASAAELDIWTTTSP